jgi:hypothetical protein
VDGGDDEAWLSIVGLANNAHLANADFRGPRVDRRHLEEHRRGRTHLPDRSPEGTWPTVAGSLIELGCKTISPTVVIGTWLRAASVRATACQGARWVWMEVNLDRSVIAQPHIYPFRQVAAGCRAECP